MDILTAIAWSATFCVAFVAGAAWASRGRVYPHDYPAPAADELSAEREKRPAARK